MEKTDHITPIQRPPGLPPALLGGNILQLRWDALRFLVENARINGDIATVLFGTYHVYQVTSPELIHEVLVTHADKFHKSTIYKRTLSHFLGNGLLISDGEFWKRQRRLAQPAFHTRRIEAYAQIMVDYTRRMLADWHANQTRDLADEMMRLTLFIVAKTLFDADVSGQSDQISKALEVLLHNVIAQTQMLIRLPAWLPTPARRRKQWSIATLDRVIMDVIQTRRATQEDKGDLLSMLLMAQDDDGGQMTDKQVRDEALTIFLAGHETTANALTWTFYLLAQHPDVEARLHREVDRVLAGRPPTLADVARLTYTEQIVKEAMRLYPPAWSFSRQAIEPVKIGNYTIPARDTVIIAPYVTHRDARWFPNPEQFDPERFSAENEKRIPRYAYLPFGGGPRICIGNSFAIMEAKLILATIAQQYSLRMIPTQRVMPEPLVTLRPKYGMKMRLSPR
jgi:cytochrome P450